MDQNVARIVRRDLQRRGLKSLDELTHDQQERLANVLCVRIPELHSGLRESLAVERRQEIAQLRRGGRRETSRLAEERQQEIAHIRRGGRRETARFAPGSVITGGGMTEVIPADPAEACAAVRAVATALRNQAERCAKRGQVKSAVAAVESAVELTAAADRLSA